MKIEVSCAQEKNYFKDPLQRPYSVNSGLFTNIQGFCNCPPPLSPRAQLNKLQTEFSCAYRGVGGQGEGQLKNHPVSKIRKNEIEDL